MQRITFFTLALFMFAPALTSAATVVELQEKLGFTLATMMAITADQPIGCTIYSSKSSVRVNEPFTYAWYSSGTALQDVRVGGWPAFNVQTLAVSTRGTWKYKISFYGKTGQEYNCYHSVTVTP